MMFDINVKKAKEYLSEKERREGFRRSKERETVLSELQKLDYLWKKYEIQKVYLYGSFVDASFQKYSDVDIAIEPDIPYERLLELFVAANKRIKREVDIRLLSELPFNDAVKRDGVLIYERKDSHP